MTADLSIRTVAGEVVVVSEQLGHPIYYAADRADARAWLKTEGKRWSM
jgi:hypothetical protein